MHLVIFMLKKKQYFSLQENLPRQTVLLHVKLRQTGYKILCKIAPLHLPARPAHFGMSLKMCIN